MLSRFICRHPHIRSAVTLALVSSSSASSHHPPLPPPLPPPPPRFASPISFLQSRRSLSTGDGGDGWNFHPRGDEEEDSVFGGEDDLLSGISEIGGDAFGSERAPAPTSSGIDDANDIFAKIDKEVYVAEKTGDDWETAEGYKPWEFGDDDDDEKVDTFGIKIGGGGDGGEGIEGIGGVNVDELVVDDKEGEEKRRELEMREQELELATTLKGPNRAFGDLIAASGITEEMIDSLILLKDTRGIPGLPPLSVIEDKAIARMNAPSIRGEIERKKQEEIQKARVRQVDEKGRAYGTGRRKCSVARVWIQPGDGKFVVNNKQFDAYFPILDHRAELLRPFTVTKTLGLWDVNCTVKGGGVSGQVGAIRLGVSRALQNWEPGLRPYLKSAGYLTRDPRVVERKKPGKAKARKSFQWVKR